MATITRELFAIDKTKPNILVDFEDVVQPTLEKIAPYVTGGVITAYKSAVVQARKAKVGEVVITKPLLRIDGELYTFAEVERVITQEEVDAGAIIVINPDGDNYVIKNEEQFAKQYDKCDGGFKPKYEVRKFVQINKSICFDKWGSKQFAPAGSYLRIDNPKSVTSVTNEAFNTTYKQVNLEQERE